jgi:hypothetical protein
MAFANGSFDVSRLQLERLLIRILLWVLISIRILIQDTCRYAPASALLARRGMIECSFELSQFRKCRFERTLVLLLFEIADTEKALKGA